MSDLFSIAEREDAGGMDKSKMMLPGNCRKGHKIR